MFITALVVFLCILCAINCRTDEIEYHLYWLSASVPQKEQLRTHMFECTDEMSCTDIITPPLGECVCGLLFLNAAKSVNLKHSIWLFHNAKWFINHLLKSCSRHYRKRLHTHFLTVNSTCVYMYMLYYFFNWSHIIFMMSCVLMSTSAVSVQTELLLHVFHAITNDLHFDYVKCM